MFGVSRWESKGGGGELSRVEATVLYDVISAVMAREVDISLVHVPLLRSKVLGPAQLQRRGYAGHGSHEAGLLGVCQKLSTTHACLA